MAQFEINFLPDHSDETLCDEVRRVAELVGKPVLTTNDFSKYAKVSVKTLRKRFGDWQGILRAAGIEHLYSGQPITDHMQAIILNVYPTTRFWMQ